MSLNLFLNRLILDLKIYYKVYGIYPKRFKNSKIQSLLPPKVESKIQNGTIIEKNVTIPAKISFIGRHVYIGQNTSISHCQSIGSFTSISMGVRIGLMSHPQNFISTSPVFYASRRGFVAQDTYQEDEGKNTVIGADVLISANVLIRNGVTIGHGAIIGAGAFVDKDIPPYAIAVGAPARVIGYRFEEALIERLLKSSWWEIDDHTLKTIGHYNNPNDFLDTLNRLQQKK